jgi:peroxiredoxin
MAKRFLFDLFHLFLYAALIGLAVEVIVLVRQNRQSRILIHDLNQALASLSLQKGDPVPGFGGMNLTGIPTTISYGSEDQKTLLFVFSTECAVCEKNIPFWNYLYENVDAKKYRLIGITRNDPFEAQLFVEDQKIKFPVVVTDELSFWWSYKLFRLPQTILINEQGVVEHVGQGVLDKPARGKMLKIMYIL